MNVAVIGMGYVGATMSIALGLHGHQVRGIDVDKAKIQSFRNGILPIYEIGMEESLQQLIAAKQIEFFHDMSAIAGCSLIMIAVGTPESENGRADLSYVRTVARQIGKHVNQRTVIVIKSTVPIGTGDQIKQIIEEELVQRGASVPFEVVSNPEFLREGRALEDALHPERIVIGCRSNWAKEKMKELYMACSDRIFFTTVRDSEMIKYASNAFLATKISFVNELARLTEKVGANITEVTKGMGLDSRIGEKFLHAGIGYGGSCFPKDTSALLSMGQDNGVDQILLQAVKQVNKTQVQWFCQKISSFIGDVKHKQIALLGLTFKPNTDDIREAPALHILRYFLDRKAHISVYDPKGMDAARQLYPSVLYCSSPTQAMDQADAVVIATEWQEIINLDWEKAKKLVKQPIVFDGRNALSPKKMENLGFRYIGVGVCSQ